MGQKPELIIKIENTFSQQSPVGKRIGGWLLSNLSRIPFETADSIARAAGTTGISVGRYLRRLGYQNLDDAKRSLLDTPDAGNYLPWGMNERLDAWQQQQGLPDRARQSLQLETDAIRHVYQLAQQDIFTRVSQQLAQADAVFILGIQSTRGIANAFFSHLEYLRPRVIYTEGQSGSWVESLNSGFAHPYLVVTDTRAYSAVARQFCQVASERGLSLALITDIWCPWARDYPVDLLQVKTDTGQFWDSLAPLNCLFNLLLSAVVEALGEQLSGRLAVNRQLQHTFGQFER